MPNSVKVFISYSHDSKDHKDRILALSDQLRYDGIDCWIDQFENNTPEIGWSQWMQKKISESHFILIICTEFYLKQFSINRKPNDEDLNQNWKGPILHQESIYGQIKNKKFVPIVVSKNDTKFIHPIFQESKQFVLESDYEHLHSFLTEQKPSEILINQKLTNKPKNIKPLSTSSVRNIKNEGVLYLLKQSNIIGHEDDINKASKEVVDIASEIYDRLNGAQPAIEIVSSYIRETKITLIQYLLLFKPEDKEISSQSETRQDHSKFLTVALNLTLEQIQKICPLAIEFIQLCSFFDSRLIPNEIFLEEKEIDFLKDDQEEKTDWNLHWNKIIDITCRYSILNQSKDKQSLRMSGIIQQTIRDNLKTPELWAEKSLKTLEAAFPDPDFTSWPVCEELIPCSRAILNWINKFGLQIPQTARLCNDVGYYLNSQGDYTEAEKFFQKAYSIRCNFYGEEHALVASTLSNIAWNHKVRKQHEKAEKTYQETILLWKKIYFGDHPDVAISLDNLGNFYRDIGQYRKAEEVYKEALEIFEKFLGDEHLDVVHSLNNLALLYKTQERFADAESLYTDAIEIHENILGNEHPEIAVAKTNLADLYLKQSRFKDAEFVLNEALKIREKAFEKHDPIIASSINNFGILYLKMKNYPTAETYLQKALNLFQNTLGFDHPNTINVMKNLEKTKEKQT
jgi:tetratricopeptide (TPR) repeat protein